MLSSITKTAMVGFEMHSLATFKDLVILMIFLIFQSTCIDDFLVWPNYLYILYFSFSF